MSLYNNIRVSGAGSPGVDGLYRYLMQVNGQPVWLKVGGNGEFDRIYLGFGGWFINYAGTKAYQSVDAIVPALPWDVVEWAPQSGFNNPPPLVIEVQGNNQRIDGFKSRWTPILAADGGFQAIGTPGASTVKLVDLVANPELLRDANGAWIQCADSTLGYAFSGEDGVAIALVLQAAAGEIVYITNREQLAGCVIAAASDVFVQFFTGRVGSRI